MTSFQGSQEFFLISYHILEAQSLAKPCELRWVNICSRQNFVLPQHIICFSIKQNFSLAHSDDTFKVLCAKINIVSDGDNRLAALTQGFDRVRDARDIHQILSCCGLIEDHDWRIHSDD